VNFICNKWLFHLRFIFVYVVGAFITLHWKALYKYMSPFSSMLLVIIRLFLSINFLYT
jgi:hypothetical protein